LQQSQQQQQQQSQQSQQLSGVGQNVSSSQQQQQSYGRPRPQPIACTPPPEALAGLHQEKCDAKTIQHTCSLFGLDLVSQLQFNKWITLWKKWKKISLQWIIKWNNF
jgi:hypothetical protein